MRTIIAILVAGFVMVVGSGAYSDELALTTPISAIEMDRQGNITAMKFGNGVVLEKPQVKLEELHDSRITGIRPLPLQLMEVSSSPASLAVVFSVTEDMCPVCACRRCGYKCCIFELDKVSGSIELNYNSEGQMYQTEPSSSEFPKEGVSVLRYGSYALVEYIDGSTGENKFGVLGP